MFRNRLCVPFARAFTKQRVMAYRHAAMQHLEERRLLAIDAPDMAAFSAESLQKALEAIGPVRDSPVGAMNQRRIELVAQSVANAALGRIVTDDTFYLLRNVITVSEGENSVQFVSSDPVRQALADSDIRNQIAAAGIDLTSAEITSLPTLAYSGDPEAIQPLTEILAVIADAAQSEPPDPVPQAARFALAFALPAVSKAEQAAMDAGLVGPVFLSEDEIKAANGGFDTPNVFDEVDEEDGKVADELAPDESPVFARLALASPSEPPGPDAFEYLTGPTEGFYKQAIEFKLHRPLFDPESSGTREIEVPYAFHIDWGDGLPAETIFAPDGLPMWYGYQGASDETVTISVDLFIDANLNEECDDGEFVGHSSWDIAVSAATFDAPQQALIQKVDALDDNTVTTTTIPAGVIVTLNGGPEADPDDEFDFVVDWGDGTSIQTFSLKSDGDQVSHDYVDSGSREITVERFLPEGSVPEASSTRTISVATAHKKYNPNTTNWDLEFAGTDASEILTFGEGATANSVTVFVSLGDDEPQADMTAPGINGAILIDSGAGNDVVNAMGVFNHRLVIDSGDGDDLVLGGTFGESNASVAADLLDGGDGNDSMAGFAGSDVLHGGTGQDFILGGLLFAAFESDGDNELFGDADDDILVGAAGADTLWGGTGNDVVVGGSGDDFLYGEDGDDFLIGGVINGIASDGADLIEGGDGNDALIGGWYLGNSADGNDTLRGQGGDDSISGGQGNDSLDGGEGRDMVFQEADADMTLSDSQATGVGTDTLAGFEFAFFLGGDSDNIIDAEAYSGEARLVGFGGADEISGGSGADTLIGGDWIGSYPLDGNDTIWGGLGNDTLAGGEGSDELHGGAGDDYMFGGHFDSNIAQDFIDGADSLFGDQGKDRIWGGDGDDELYGGADADALFGGDGADSFEGGAGRDLVVGGLGLDDLLAGDEEDVSVGGDLSFGADDEMISEVLAEWFSEGDYVSRVSHLSGESGGLNGGAFLNLSALIDDEVMDNILGGLGRDWFPDGATGATIGDAGTGEVVRPNTRPSAAPIGDIHGTTGMTESVVDLFEVFSDDDPDSELTFSVANNTVPNMFQSISINAETGELVLTYSESAGSAGAAQGEFKVLAYDPNGFGTEIVVGVFFGPIVNSPPIINEFTAEQVDVNFAVIDAHVLDEFPGGLTVVFGGLLDGFQVTTTPLGYFNLVVPMNLHDEWIGAFTIQTTDPQGLVSNRIVYYTIGWR